MMAPGFFFNKWGVLWVPSGCINLAWALKYSKEQTLESSVRGCYRKMIQQVEFRVCLMKLKRHALGAIWNVET